jgi:hypothetical protein
MIIEDVKIAQVDEVPADRHSLEEEVSRLPVLAF